MPQYSCKISSNQSLEYIHKTWGSQQSGYIVKVWFYDSGRGVDDGSIVLCDDSSLVLLIGVSEDSSPNPANYFYRVGSNYYDTGIARSVGWHEIKFDYTNGTICVGYIDGEQIFSVGDPDTFNRLFLGNLWGDANGIGYFDDVDIGELLSDDFETCNLAGWSVGGGTPECSNDQNHTPSGEAIILSSESTIPVLEGVGLI